MEFKNYVDINFLVNNKKVNLKNEKRIPLSSRQRDGLKRIYPYYGAQGIIDYVDDYIFDGKYLLIAEDGANLITRKENIANIAKGKFWVNNHAHILEIKDFYLFYFIYYYINSISINDYITGSVQPKLNKKNLLNLKVVYPSKAKIKKIVKILLSFDKKIEVNNKIIQNLEDQAQALFKYYFVDFGPFKDGDFVDSELGKIPKGWEVEELSNIFQFKKGKRAKKTKDEQEKIPYIVKGVVDGKENPEFVSAEKTIQIDELDIFMLMDGANSSNIYYGFKGALGSTFALLSFSSNELKELIYLLLKSSENELKLQNTGSAIPHANKGYIYNMKIALPDNEKLLKYFKIFKHIRTKTVVLQKENQKLAQVRDSLLPRLMNGEIDLSNIELKED